MSLLELEVPFERWLFDGAIGTELQKLGELEAGHFVETLNLEAPQAVRELHQAYREAGATLLTSNTFSANRIRLEKRGLGDRTRELNLAGAQLARKAAGEGAWVAGSIGPLGAKFITPYGFHTVSYEEAVATFAEQAGALEEGGIDLFIVETMLYPLELQAAVEGIQSVSERPIIASMSYLKEWGNDPAAVARAASGWGVAAIGANCNAGPETYLPIVRAYRANSELPILVEPNAGQVRFDFARSQASWGVGVNEFVEGMSQLRECGASLIGGCCGSTPAYIRALRPLALET